MFNKLVIISDDLTGAADCSSRCSTLDVDCTVYLSAPNSTIKEKGIIALNTDSRFLSGEEAREKVIKVLKPLAKNTDIVWYKKIDSTLRGNIGQELEALVSTIFLKENKPLIILSSAFPAQNRGLNNGYLFSPTTGFAKAYLPEIIKKQSRFKVSTMAVGDLRSNKENVANYLQKEIDQGTELLIVDALLEYDLESIANASALLKNKNILLCGSAGLVVHLAKHLLKTGVLTKNDQRENHKLDKKSSTLGVIGSGSLAAHRQIAFLREKSATVVKRITANFNQTELENIIHPANILLHLPEPQDRSLDNPLAREHAKPLIEIAANFIAEEDISKILVSGGDTSSLLLNKLGIEKLSIIKEIFPGMPVCLGISNTGKKFYLVLKSGNHGEESTLVFLFNFLSTTSAL